MKKTLKLKQIIFIGLIISIIAFSTVGCKPFDKPEIITIEASQTAFLIPLDGKTSNQTNFMSEQFLISAKIATKQIQIPHRWIQEGRALIFEEGRYIPSAKLILVERKPETREWTEGEKNGTSSRNEGIVAESKESISFMSRMNASAQINEEDAVKFLYRYNNKSLAEVMDTEIRARIESKFVEECSKRTLEEILNQKDVIMKAIRDDVEPYFKDKGITITIIGLKGEFTYMNPEIQASIDNKFKSAQDLITQDNENKRVVSKADADAKAITTQASTIDKTLRMKELDNQSKAIEKWNGELPQYNTGNSGMMFNIPATDK